MRTSNVSRTNFILLRGGVEKLFCSIFNPLISLNIYYDQYQKIRRKNQNNFFPAVRFRGNGGHIRLHGTHQGTYKFKTATSNAVKSCTHMEDIYMKKRRPYTSVFFVVLLNNTVTSVGGNFV